ncbi:MAG: TolC family protein [Armatimonadota bacterium]|nr:TolC family protein [Armatimonadota bacterium]MDR7551019.1 TolC family protein [Armatimonadota bacterium]
MNGLTHSRLRACLAAVALLVFAAPAGVAMAQALASAPAHTVAQAPRPITLLEALTLAVQNNHGLRAAAFEVTVARAQLAQAEAFKRGLLTGSASYTRINERSGGTITIPPIPGITPSPVTITLPPPDPNIYSVGVVYQFPLYSGGRFDWQIALAQANVRGAEAALERAKQHLVLDVRQAYFQMLLAQAGVEVAQRTVTSAEENLRLARARVAAGASPRFDEVQAEVTLANARQSLIRARNGLALAQHGLNTLLALPQDTALAPRETMTAVPLRTGLEALIRRALENRPELVEHRARLAAAQAAVEVARAGLRPLVVVQGGPTYGNASGTGGAPTPSAGWSVTLLATLTLSDGNQTAERIREAEARVAQLREAEAQLRQAVELEVRRAVLNHAASAEELAAADKIIEQAQEQLRIASVRFAAGVSTNFEVITALAAVSQAEANRIQALFNLNVARAQLERAVGGGVE